MMRIPNIRNLIRHKAFTYTIRGCSSMWMRLKSARLVSRSPEYWLHHMGCERTLAAALQRQHDAGLILSNLPVFGQFVNSLNRLCRWRLIGSRFRRKPCSLCRRLTVFDGQRTIWQPWACGVHPVRRGSMAPAVVVL